MRVALSWSSGKDAAWALHVLRQQQVDVVGLLTTFQEATGRVAMHAVPRSLVEAQAAAAGLPLHGVDLPWPCPNAVYEARMRTVLAPLAAEGVTHVAFGDLFLEDIRGYRERLLAGTALAPLFPLWHPPGGTAALARAMLDAGLGAVLTCVDGAQLAPAFAGRGYDPALLAALPAGVDPCGEQGAFHTFCHAGPMFEQPIGIRRGGVVEREGYWYAEVGLVDAA